MLLLAAGRGSRFGGPVPKAFLQLAGRPLVLVGAERLITSMLPADTWELLVVVHPTDREHHLAPCLPSLRALVAGRGGLRIVDGGDSRQDSVRCGLVAAAPDADLILVHDAARALLPIAATRLCVQTAATVGAALLAIPVPDTLKRVVDERVEATIDRSGVWLAQTPQVIRRELLVRAIDHAVATGVQGTDDVSLVERLGAPVAIVAGAATNLKITRPEDLPLAEAILASHTA